MTRDVSLLQPQRKLFWGGIYVVVTGLFVWNVWQLHQMSQRYSELKHTLATEYPVALQEMNAVSVTSPLNICRPLLPVQLWNRNPEDVPIPPRWHRRVV